MLELLNRMIDSMIAMLTCVPDGMRLRERMLDGSDASTLFDDNGRVIGR